jgi:hypothetical protein
MPRLAHSLTAALIILLSTQATQLWAQDSEPSTEGSQQSEQPAAVTRPPLIERSALEATALEQQLEKKEQQQLQAGDESFLALWLPANVAEPSGVVIILPGDEETADWPESVGPLRHKLPDAGWHSLSLTLPDPNSDALPPRSATPPEPPADSAAPPDAQATGEPAPDKTTADANSETAATPLPSPEEQQKAHAERVLARIESAIGFAEQQQAKTIVLLGHGSGAYWAARYLAERKPANIQNLLLVAAELPTGYTPPLDELIPQLQLATGDFYYKDLPADRQAALERSQASKRQKHPAYIQVAMKALPGNREAEQEQLYRRIKGWLKMKLQAK